MEELETGQAALSSLQQVQAYIMKRGGTDYASAVRALEDQITALSLSRMRERKITDYFSTQSSSASALNTDASSNANFASGSPAITKVRIAERLCGVCNLQCGFGHICQVCLKAVHATCGATIGDEEGYGAPVICYSCQ